MRQLLRGLYRARTYALLGILTLGVIIGVNALIFSIVNGVLVRELPYPEPDRLVWIWLDNRAQGYPEDVTSYPNFLDFERENETFDALAAIANGANLVTGNGEPERLLAAAVSEGFFDVVGVEPILGRAFTRDDFVTRERVVLLGHGVWQRRFGADATIVGRTILLDEEPSTVIGVMPEWFRIPEERDLWLPLTFEADDEGRTERNAFWLYTIGRRERGVSTEEARADLAVIMARIEERFYASRGAMGVVLNSFHEQLVRELRPGLLLLGGAVTVLWLIACTNLAGVSLARAQARRGEFALRRTLGASRGRVVFSLLAEGALMGTFAVPVGAATALLGRLGLRAAPPSEIAELAEVPLDASVFLFTVALAIGSGVLTSLSSAMMSPTFDLAGSLREAGGRRVGREKQTSRRALVVAQVGLALVLLLAAALMLRSLLSLERVPVGFAPENLYEIEVTLVGPRYESETERIRFLEELVRRASSIPGVESASITTSIFSAPLSGADTFTVEGFPVDPNRTEAALTVSVSPDHFEMMGIPLLRGRELTSRDTEDSQRVVVVNRTMAERYWPGRDPVGGRMELGTEHESEPDWRTVVGVVGDVRRTAPDRAPRPAVFLPLRQRPTRWSRLVLRSELPAERIFPLLKEAAWSLDDTLPLPELRSVSSMLDDRLADPRFHALLVAVFAIASAFLASAGLYGILAYSASRRTKEMGVRMALGARSSDVTGLVVRDGAGLLLPGVALGALAAYPLRGLLAGLLYEVRPLDPISLIAAAGILVATGLAGAYLPARRAARVDPSIALRQE